MASPQDQSDKTIQTAPTAEPTMPPSDNTNFSYSGENLKKIFALEANPLLYAGMSTPAIIMHALMEIEKKRDEKNREVAVIATVEQFRKYDAAAQKAFKEEFGDDFRKAEKTWNTLTNEEKQETHSRREAQALKIQNELREKHGIPPQNDAQARLEANENLAEIAKQEEAYDQLAFIENRIEALEQEAAQQKLTAGTRGIAISTAANGDASIDLKSLTAFQEIYTDPGIQKAVAAKQSEFIKNGQLAAGESLSAEKQQMIAYQEHLPKQLETSEQLLEKLIKAKDELDERIDNLPPHISDNIVMRYLDKQDDLEKAIEEQSNRVDLERKLVEFTTKHEEQLLDMSIQEAMTFAMTERPDIIAAYNKLNNEEDAQQALAVIAEQAGMSPEQIKTMGAELQRIKEAGEALAKVKQTVVEYGGRHNFLEKSMGIEAEGGVMKVVEALRNADTYIDKQSKPLEHEGNLVHHNERGLYSITVDDFGRTHREYYTDPTLVAELRAKAWDPKNPVLYANETPFSEDPKNGKEETYARNLSEKAVLEQIKSSEGVLANTVAGKEGEPENIKPAFSEASAPPEPKQSSMLQNTFEGVAMKAGAYVLDIFIDREEPKEPETKTPEITTTPEQQNTIPTGP